MPDITMSSSISKMLFIPIPSRCCGSQWRGCLARLLFSGRLSVPTWLLLVVPILRNRFDSFVWFCVVLYGNGSRFSCLGFYSYYSIEQAFIKVSLSKRGLCSAHIPAKSRTMLRSASCLANIWAIALKCFLVILYQRVWLYKGFFTRVEKLAVPPGFEPGSWGRKPQMLGHYTTEPLV